VVYDWLKIGQFGELRHPSCSRALIQPEAPRKLLVEAQAPRLANQIQGMQKRRSVALSDDARLVPWLPSGACLEGLCPAVRAAQRLHNLVYSTGCPQSSILEADFGTSV